MRHTDEVLQCPACDRIPAVRKGDRLLQALADGLVRVEPVDVGRRDHHVPRLLALEVDDVVQELLLVAGDHARALRLVDKRP